MKVKWCFGYIYVRDECWRQNLLLTTSKFCQQNKNFTIFYLGHMKEMIENFNRYQIINESTGNVIKVSSFKHLKVLLIIGYYASEIPAIDVFSMSIS